MNSRGNTCDARDNVSIEDVKKFTKNNYKAKMTRKKSKNSQDDFLCDSFSFDENGYDKDSLVESNLSENKEFRK